MNGTYCVEFTQMDGTISRYEVSAYSRVRALAKAILQSTNKKYQDVKVNRLA